MNLKIFGIEWGDRDSIRSHIWLFVQPALVGGIAVFCSSTLQLFADTYFHAADREFVITGPLALLALLHSIIAGHMFMDVLRRHREVCVCILKKDKETFDMNREVHLPGFAKFFLGLLSFILVLFVSLIDFHAEWTSTLSVFCVTFVISTYWVMITELEDPVSGVWFGNRAPLEWLIEEDTSCKI